MIIPDLCTSVSLLPHLTTPLLLVALVLFVGVASLIQLYYYIRLKIQYFDLIWWQNNILSSLHLVLLPCSLHCFCIHNCFLVFVYAIICRWSNKRLSMTIVDSLLLSDNCTNLFIFPLSRDDGDAAEAEPEFICSQVKFHFILESLCSACLLERVVKLPLQRPNLHLFIGYILFIMFVYSMWL